MICNQNSWIIANAIETQWQENPKLSFNEALSEFKKFGVFGFMDVVEKRQTVLSKKIQLYCLATFQRFFGVLRLLTIAITLLLFSVLKIGVYSEWILLVSIFY
jgi:hypothetical protein